MALRQALNSVGRILSNRHVSRTGALARYASWQVRRLRGGFPVELTLSRSVLLAHAGNCGVSSLVNAHGLYDYNNMSLIKALLGNGGTFIDVGANIGAYTLVAAEQHAAIVLAVEPHPGTHILLAENVTRNGYSNVMLLQAAAGAAEGSVRITDTPGASTTHINFGADGIEVPLRRLDSILVEKGLSPGIVKVDVEGFELDVLRGLGERLADVSVLIVEINELGESRASNVDELQQFIASAGLSGPWYCDFDQRRLTKHLVHEGEDPLFVSRAAVDQLRQIHGIQIE